MNKWFILSGLLFFNAGLATGQNTSFDIVTYPAPAGWKEEKKESNILYSRIDGNNWGQIVIYRHSASLGNRQIDFDNEWKELVAKPYGIQQPGEKAMQDTNGWKITTGSGIWLYKGVNVASMLTTISNDRIVVSVLCNATSTTYLEDYEKLLAALKTDVLPATAVDNFSASTPVTTGFKFNDTKFDDGWTSTIQQEWVEVTKGNIKVLIHYPKEGTIFPADPDVLTNAAWDILIKPRYRNLKEYKTTHVPDFNRPYFGTGYATEIKSGKEFFVVLFRRGGGWMEIVTHDISSFTQEFGFNAASFRWGKIGDYLGGYIVDNSQGKAIQVTTELIDRLDRMVNYNRFAVAASDLNNTGQWDARYTNNTFYYNYYTDSYAGMSTYTSSEWFVFGNGQTYSWKLAAVNSTGGQMKIAQSEGKGTYRSLNNWQMLFTNIGGKPKTYDVYFTATQNGRVLFINDAKHPGSGVFTGFARKN